MRNTQENAENLLSQKLEKTNIKDFVYECAMNLFQKCVNEVESECGTIESDGDGEATWFDEMRDDFIKSVFDQLNN